MCMHPRTLSRRVLLKLSRGSFRAEPEVLSPGVRQPSFDPFGICRTYREAVTDHSPGLQPWVNRTEPHALKVASEVVSLALVLSLDDAPCWRDWWNQHIK